MNYLTSRAIDERSALRSIALVCMALLTTNACYRVSISIPEGRLPAETRKCDTTDGLVKLVDLEQPTNNVPIGAHLISPRGFYLHHGIYLGGHDVAHYSGFSGSLRSGPIEVTDLEHFANGKPIWMLPEQGQYSCDEIAQRARSRLGENRYRILSNNCEHFCNWCVSGKNYSLQVNAYFKRPRYLFAFISALEPYLIA
ncbi:lecithin retinol acyltransferase family protein [Pseudomonas sp. Q12-87]|uniref:lecithin retinol acyltransferase family protein n=1 Tax=Pseudomonas sp. Q12-87 TaxID=177989 RepID=UPI00069EEF16|nr:lecithin retinol acyltransferase family protein [Pseudomonas sp. Q12-87]